MLVSEKINLAKTYPEYYTANQKPKIVNLEPYHYLSIQGQSAPESPIFLDAMGQLYSLAYRVKSICKEQDLDFVVPKLEGFWWVEGHSSYENTPRSQWHWKLLLRMPDFVGGSDVKEAMTILINDQKIPENHRLLWEEIHEGLCVQMLHTGSYENEKATVEKLIQFVKREGFDVVGKHHEIYLSDPRKTEESKLRTIIRYAIQ
ncbi:GyrI-like domain-containing protein [Roseivirga thermotolerans]|uniref:GyrI-like small molecule binding domain-containing protein n=1 Tax=Roseivirga thermotolerans TaxID=1758176 RepID=A0ABQ3I4Q2_9BACT|nr:GyrI-like domain-containing protein [Roseivirga thermotolerans]GHE57087.1 hypothetical protein GCM10011340_10130 [Roseivirga thermotolerans]